MDEEVGKTNVHLTAADSVDRLQAWSVRLLPLLYLYRLSDEFHSLQNTVFCLPDAMSGTYETTRTTSLNQNL